MDAPIDVWNEVRITSEGISISLLSESTDGAAVVEDEMWFTFDEMEEMAPARPQSLNLSPETRAALSQQSGAPTVDELVEELDQEIEKIEQEFNRGDEVEDLNPPEWSEDNRLIVRDVTDQTADEYAVEVTFAGINRTTVADVNPTYSPDDTVVECVYVDEMTNDNGYINRKISDVPEDDIYAFPSERLSTDI